MKYWSNIVLLFVCGCVTVMAQGQTSPTKLPKGVSTDWWSTVQRNITQTEYKISKAKRPLPESGEALQAPNRKQNFRTWFMDDGIQVNPRTEKEPAWTFTLRFIGYGSEKSIESRTPIEPESNGNHVSYPDDRIEQWFENREDGLEQGFTVKYPEDGDDLIVQMSLEGNLKPSLKQPDTVELLTEGGVRVLQYGNLKVTDAEGKNLDAHFILQGTTLTIHVDAKDAVFPVTVDPLLSTPSWTAESDQAYAELGYSVASAGDVNGDGYSDVIVGAPSYDNGQTSEGGAFVYLGSASGLNDTAVWTAESNSSFAYFGRSVSSAGDVNGDGYSDVIIGAPGYYNGQYSEGRAYVYLGSISGLSGTAAWTVESNKASAVFGSSVASAGDVNGDGYSDVIVGAYYYDNGQTGEGRAFLYLGSTTGLSSAPAWTAGSDQANAYFGCSVSSAGDVNGDGYSDVIVGELGYSNGQTLEGRVLVYLGSTDGLSSTAAWTVESDQENAHFGSSVSSAGDVNGDGYSDVIVGAPYYDHGQTNEGRAFIYLGSASGLSSTAAWSATESDQANAVFGSSVASAGDVNGDGYSDVIVGTKYNGDGETYIGRAYVYLGSASGLASTYAWTRESDQANSEFGWSVSSAGDVNGDGYSDVIVGAPYYDHGQTNEGRAFVYLGSASSLSETAVWTAESNQASASFGASVSSAGDVNGDGYSDVIVGAPSYDHGQTNEGRAFVYLGSTTGLSASPAWTAESDQTDAMFGVSVSSAGDVNGDGYSDVIVGAPSYDHGETDEGRTYLYLGSPSGLSAISAWTAESDQEYAYFGTSVSSAGDVNGDGYGDVIVGAVRYTNGETDEGRAYLYLGSPSGLSAISAWTAESDQTSAWFGNSVSSAGDVNGDGYSDVIVGAPSYDHGETNEGRAFVYLGSASGLSASPAWTAESDRVGAQFGWSVSSAGDVNGDGYSDVIVGAPSYDHGEAYEGRAFVYLGSASGLSTAPAWTAESNQASATFGYSVASAGDVNRDGYSDVIVGAPNYGNGQVQEGRAFLYLGSETGLSTTAAWTAESDQTNAMFGVSVSSAGDVNGDGYSDVIIGTPGYDNGETDEGIVLLYFGNNGPSLAMLPGQYQSDGTSPVQLNGLNDTSAILKLRGHTPMGRTRVKLQWQINELGIPFGAPGTPGQTITGQSADWIDTLDGNAMISQTITGLSVNTPYHWQVRLLYDPVTSDQVASRWYSIQDNGWNDVDFRTLNPTYTVSGTVTDGTNPIPDVTITFSHDGGTVVTDAAGYYSYTVPYGTTTTISASSTGYSNWSPPFIVVNNITADQPNQDFMATANGYIVSGTVTDGLNPISGVALTFSHDGSVVYSNAAGVYSATVPYGTTTTITPSAAGYATWSPPSRTITSIASNQTGQDFTAILNGVTVSGTVTNGTDPISGVTVSFSHDGGSVLTDGSGTYSYVVPYGTSTVVTPSLANYTFTPDMIPLANLTADSGGNDFVGNTAHYAITATAGPDGVISPSGVVSVAHGADQAFTVVPDPGFHIDYLQVDGDFVTPVGTYMFHTVTEPHSIHASFAVNVPPVITSFTSDRLAGNLPLTVMFSCEANTPDGAPIVSYGWDFDGNGTVDATTATGNAPFTYRTAEVYDATVTVTNSEGMSATAAPLAITVTDAAPLMLPVGLPVMLNDVRGTSEPTMTVWVVNPFPESLHGTLTAKDENGADVGTSPFTLAGYGKQAVDLSGFGKVDYTDVALTADHYLLVVADVAGDAFRFTAYQPLETASLLYVPHVAEEVDQWDSLAFISNYDKIGVDLMVHGTTTGLDPAFQSNMNLTPLLPESVDGALSWGSFTGRASNPFADADSLTGFEAFLRKGSDGAALMLGNRTSTTLYIPHIPTETGIFWTGLAFLNPSEIPVNATATLYDNAGNVVGTYPFEVAAGARIKGVLNDLFPGSNGTATWGMIHADGAGLIGLELFGTFQDGICGFPLMGATAKTGVFPLLETESENWTGLAFANPNNQEALLTLELVGMDGVVKATYDIEIAPMSRSAAVAGDLFSLSDMAPGDYVRFTSDVGLATVSVSGDTKRSWMSAIGARE